MQRRLTSLLVAGSALAAACSGSDLTVPNTTVPTTGSLAGDPRGAAQFLVSGILAADRNSYSGFILNTGSFGRESFNVFLTDGRTVTGFYQNFADPAGFAAVNWTAFYQTLRNIGNVRALETTGKFSTAEVAGLEGFLKTEEALQLYWLTVVHNNLGIVVKVDTNASVTNNFVSRDSALSQAATRLDEGFTALSGASFAPSFAAGYDAYGTPATYALFNRMIKARVQANRASLALGAGPSYAPSATSTTLYQSALAALGQVGAFVDGPAAAYSTAAGDVPNTNLYTQSAAAGYYAYPTIVTDSGISLTDRRITAYTAAATTASPSSANVTTSTKLVRWPSQTQKIPYITAVELQLIRAEARYFTGDAAGALADINAVRTTDGQIAARGAFTSAQDFVTELLLQRRLSLLSLGHRWNDVRRFGLLNTLPAGGATFAKTANGVIPQAECVARQNTPDTSDDCAPYAPTDPQNPTP